MNRSSEVSFPAIRLLGAVLSSAIMLVAVARAADKKAVAPAVIWPGAESAVVVREAMSLRIMSGDEIWSAAMPRFVDVDPGSSPRNILLPAIGGSGGVAAGTVLMARFSMPAGMRVMLRDAGGGLLGMVNGGDAGSVQWVSLRAQADRWEVRVSPAREMPVSDGVFLWGGARPVVAPAGADMGVVRPANPRTSGFSIRFESDAPALVLNASGERIRLRVIADGRVVAVVDVSESPIGRSSIGVDLGDSRRRRIELLVDEGALRSVEVTDVRHGFYLWKAASPQVRMLVLGDDAASGAARAYPWALASRLDFECWSLAWGDGAARLGASAGVLVPEDLIAADVSAAEADVVLVTGRVMDSTKEGDEYAEHVGQWLDAIARAARPDAVKIVIPAFSVDAGDKRARVIEKAAKQRGFLFVNWQGWIAAAETGGLVDLGGRKPSEAGQIFLGGRLADEFVKLEVGVKARTSLLKRTALAGSN